MTINSRTTGKLLLIGILAGLSAEANAGLVTSNVIPDSTVIDFSTQATVSNVTGPIQIGDLVGQDVTAATITGGPGLYTNFASWGLASNGTWGTPMTYVSAQSGTGIRIAFNDGPVAQVGGFMNDAPEEEFADLTIRVLDSGMNVLEEYNLDSAAPISTPSGFNDGAFRGITRPTADIAYFEVTGESPALDNLTFSLIPTATVPVPLSRSAMLIMAFLLAALPLVLSRRSGRGRNNGVRA